MVDDKEGVQIFGIARDFVFDVSAVDLHLTDSSCKARGTGDCGVCPVGAENYKLKVSVTSVCHSERIVSFFA